jgi:phosphatidylinositol-3-phosphatase
MVRRSLKTWILVMLLSACSASDGTAPPPGSSPDLPVGKVKHVFIIVLENKSFDTVFKPSSQAPYLAQTLVSQGLLLTAYYAIGHLSLPNYIALISGQAPNGTTQTDCTTYTDFISTQSLDADGQAVGTGCVFPAEVHTFADQLTEHGLTWRAYMEDMGNDPSSAQTCRHPMLGAVDPTQSGRVGDQYSTHHNPFVYFHSLIDSPDCAANDVPLTELGRDLSSARTTASFSFITPNLCNGGHDDPCVDGSTGGLMAVNAFLQIWVPQILDSPGYKDGGLLVITFDEAERRDITSCCDEPSGPNVTAPGISGPGGGRIGAVVLSPFVHAGAVNDTPYNHYSLLRTIEDLFGLPHLGYAGRPGLRAFGTDVFSF